MPAQPQQYGDALMDMAKTFAPALDAALPGAGTAVSFILDIFGDKPCDYANAAPCSIASERWDGEHPMIGDCCNVMPGGLSVIVSEHAFGYKKWPGATGTIRAGDYYNVGCGAQYHVKWTPAGKPGYCIGFEPNRISSIIIPDGFRVQVFDQPAFKGQSLTLEPGAHELHALGWGDRIVSMKVRGPWTMRDYNIGMNLFDRKPGWITAGMRDQPDAAFVLALIMSDPQRPAPPMDFDQAPAEYESSFGPGWQDRPHAQQVFEQVLAGPQQQPEPAAPAMPPPPPQRQPSPPPPMPPQPSAPMFAPPPPPNFAPPPPPPQRQPPAQMPAPWQPPMQPPPPSAMPQQWQPGPNPFAAPPPMQSPAPWQQPPPPAPWHQPTFAPAPPPPPAPMAMPPDFLFFLQQLFQQWQQQPPPAPMPPQRAPWYGR